MCGDPSYDPLTIPLDRFDIKRYIFICTRHTVGCGCVVVRHECVPTTNWGWECRYLFRPSRLMDSSRTSAKTAPSITLTSPYRPGLSMACLVRTARARQPLSVCS